MRAMVMAALLPLGAAAQGLELPEEIGDADGVASAARSLAEAGVESVLIADLIGLEIAGPDGETVGTVEDLVAIPGGRLVAAIVSLPDGPRIAVPYGALKVTGARDAVEATLPVAADALAGMPVLEELAGELAP